MGDDDQTTPLFFSSDGFFYPCCWAGGPNNEFKHLTKEKFKLENNDSIDDIIRSDEWNKFYSDLLDKPEDAPNICKRNCGKSRIVKGKL